MRKTSGDARRVATHRGGMRLIRAGGGETRGFATGRVRVDHFDRAAAHLVKIQFERKELKRFGLG